MSKITKALNKAQKERFEQGKVGSEAGPIKVKTNSDSEKGAMHNSWLIWVFIIGVIITVFVAFNYESGNDAVPLSEIFPDEETYPVDIEYEFVDEGGETAKAMIKEVKEDPRTQRQSTQSTQKLAAQQSSRVQAAARTQEKVSQQLEQKANQVAQVPQRVAQQANNTATTNQRQSTTQRAAPQETVAQKQSEQKQQFPIMTAAEAKKIPYTIQVASFKTQTRAEKAIQQLGNKDLGAYIVTRNLGDKGIWYRVYVGRFDSKDDAQSTLAQVKKIYKDSFVISPKK